MTDGAQPLGGAMLTNSTESNGSRPPLHLRVGDR